MQAKPIICAQHPATAGAHNTLNPTPTSIIAAGVTRISTFVSLETNLPTSLATIHV